MGLVDPEEIKELIDDSDVERNRGANAESQPTPAMPQKPEYSHPEEPS